MGEEQATPDRLWLVFVRHDTKTWLAWLAVGHGHGHPRKCPPGSHGCGAPRIYGDAVELLNARSGNGMMVTGFARGSDRHGPA